MAAIPIGIGLYELGQLVLVGLGLYTAKEAGEALSDAYKARESARSEAAKCDPTNPLSPCFCPARTGLMSRVNHAMSPVSRAYQARITGFPPYHEWIYMGVDFDGFRSVSCTLVEAKAQYAQFLDPETGFTTWRRWYSGGFVPQALRQSAVAIPRPPVFLHWFFMELPVQTLAVREFGRVGLLIDCFYVA